MKYQLLSIAVMGATLVTVQGTASASPFSIETKPLAVLDSLEVKPTEPKPPQPKKQKHKVVSGDSLTKIAQTYNSTVQRLFDKNTKIKHPDVIAVGQAIVIPSKDEKLKKRTIPVAVVQVVPRTGYVAPAGQAGRGSSSGNTYGSCQCTFYAKSRRPDLPNNLGNADTWYYRAQAQGIPTGTKPRVGAIGMFTSYMHVAYVEAVRGNKVQISEWNYAGPCVKTVRWVPAGDLLYIY